MVAYAHQMLRALGLLLTPTLRLGRKYTSHDVRADIVAGITVAVIQIPQSMALALIAGLPATYGLYASLPGFIAGLWGSSRQLSTGPVAIISFLTFTSLVPFAEPRTADYIGLAAALAVLVGIIYLALGLARLGFIMQLVPHSVISGFSSAAAIIIVLTQLPNLFGLAPAQNNLAIQNVIDFVLNIPHLSFISLAFGLTAILLLYFSRSLSHTFPSALIILLFSIGAGYVLTRFDIGVVFVGNIPKGIPDLAFPPLSIATLLLLLPKAAIIALVGFVGTHATAKNAALKTHEKLDTDQELVGQGLANVVTGFFAGFPIAGSFTRTAINTELGVRTPVSAMVGALVTLLTLFLFTPVFSFLPRSVLAAIVITSAIPLINFARIRAMTEISRTDGFIALLTLGLALFLAPDDALFIGVVAALMAFIWQTTSGARVAEMGVSREWNVLRGRRFDPSAETFPHTLIVYVGMSMYYANTEHLLAQTTRLIAAREEEIKEPLRNLIFDMSGVHFIDISALDMLTEFSSHMHERNIRIGMIYVRQPVRIRLEKMKRPARITIFHNLLEIKNACTNTPQLALNGTRPDVLEATL